MSTHCLKSPVIVYGANGFIGRNLLLALSDRDIETRAVSRSFDRSFTERLSGNIEYIESDFADTENLFQGIVPESGATHILLVSNSLPSTWTKAPSLEVSENLLPYVRFLERLQAVDRVVFLSSGGTVYGAPAVRRPLREHDTSAIPISAYGMTKLAIEQYLAFAARTFDFDHMILRPSNPVGPWAKPNSAQGFVSVLLENYLYGRTTHIWGDGGTVRDYLDVRDLVDAIISACMQEKLGGEVFNVGSGVGRSLNEVIALVQKTLDLDLAVEIAEGRGVDVPYNVLDCSHIEERLGWRASRDFDRAVLDTWAFLCKRHQKPMSSEFGD